MSQARLETWQQQLSTSSKKEASQPSVHVAYTQWSNQTLIG